MAIGKKQPTYGQGRCMGKNRVRKACDVLSLHQVLGSLTADNDFALAIMTLSSGASPIIIHHCTWVILTPQLKSCSQESKTVKILSGGTDYEYGVVERNRHGSPWRFATLHMSVAKIKQTRPESRKRADVQN